MGEKTKRGAKTHHDVKRPLNTKTKGTLNKYPKTKDNATTKLQNGEGVMESLPNTNPSMFQLGNLWEHQ